MTSTDLSREQTQKLMEAAARQLRYLNRLCERMLRLGFPPDDPLWRAGNAARDGMHHLHMAAHYAGCKSGLGR